MKLFPRADHKHVMHQIIFFWGVYMCLWVIVMILCEYIVVLDVEFSGT